jgi:magnesium chelatase family protein
LRGVTQEETSAAVRERIKAARELQMRRSGKANAALGSREIERYCQLRDTDHRLLEHAMERLGLSPRAYHRILKVARTIADLAGSAEIQTMHLSEAISYRALDRGMGK